MKTVAKIAAIVIGSLALAAPAFAQSAAAKGEVVQPQNSNVEKQRPAGTIASGQPSDQATQPSNTSGSRQGSTENSRR